MSVQDAFAVIGRALRKLEPEQGRIARKNARNNVKSACRSLISAMDAEFPLERKTPNVGKRIRWNNLTDAQAQAIMKKRGWVKVGNTGAQAFLGLAGIKFVHRGKSAYVPEWAVFLYEHLPTAGDQEERRALRLIDGARKSPAYRAKLEAYLRLNGDPSKAPKP